METQKLNPHIRREIWQKIVL